MWFREFGLSDKRSSCLNSGENRAACHGKRMGASLAPPLLPVVAKIMPVDSAAYLAGHFFALAPAHFLEELERLIVGDFHDFARGQGAGFCGK